MNPDINLDTLRFDALAPHRRARTALIMGLFDVYRDVERHAAVNGIPTSAVPVLATALWTEEQRLRSISAEYNDIHKATV